MQFINVVLKSSILFFLKNSTGLLECHRVCLFYCFKAAGYCLTMFYNFAQEIGSSCKSFNLIKPSFQVSSQHFLVSFNFGLHM
jgi:hypothetical protein